MDDLGVALFQQLYMCVLLVFPSTSALICTPWVSTQRWEDEMSSCLVDLTWYLARDPTHDKKKRHECSPMQLGKTMEKLMWISGRFVHGNIWYTESQAPLAQVVCLFFSWFEETEGARRYGTKNPIKAGLLGCASHLGCRIYKPFIIYTCIYCKYIYDYLYVP